MSLIQAYNVIIDTFLIEFYLNIVQFDRHIPNKKHSP